MADPELLTALQQAVDLQPDNRDLRAHLATLLQQAGRDQEALQHALVVLGLQPDHLAAVRCAAAACRATGQAERAQAYERMAIALGRDDEPDEPDEPDELDRFLTSILDDADRQRTRLADVAGLANVKRRLELSFFGPLRQPELRAAFGSTMRGGLLLYGPPGCGKTFVARAVAGELGARFLHVGLHDVLDMWLGNSEKQLHDIFEYARRNTPTVVFFDEVDAIGQSRSARSSSAGRGVVTQLLEELDGVGTNNDGLFVLGATNQPWDVDPALRRPGRFDRMLFVGPPDEEARGSIITAHLAGRPHAISDVRWLAKRTDGLSGADLRLLVQSASEFAMEESIDSGTVRPISDQHLKAAAKNSRSSIGPWIDAARNVVAFANKSGDYDELAAFLREHR